MNKVLFRAKLYDGEANFNSTLCAIFVKDVEVHHALASYKAYEIIDIMPIPERNETSDFDIPGTHTLHFGRDADDYIADVKDKAKSLFGEDYELVDLKKAEISPEFFDFHEHSEFYSFFHPSIEAKRVQCVRGSIVGNCGISVYPIIKGKEAELENSVLSILGKWPCRENGEKVYWSGLDGFRTILKDRGVNNRLEFLTGHAALRIAAIDGNPNREATKQEIDKMCSLLDAMIDEGSIGFSTGLYYAPCIFASREELLALLRVVRRRNALFAVHIREEGNALLESLNEVIELAKEAGCRLQISHLKAIGTKNQIKVDAALYLIEKAREEGLDVMFDQYPYTYGSTSLFSLLPPRILRLDEKEMIEALKNNTERAKIKEEMLSPKGWESIAELCTFKNVKIQCLGNTTEYDGLSIESIATSRKSDAFDTFFDLLIESNGLAVMKDTTTTKFNLEKIYKHPLSIFASDSLYAGTSWHPRSTECTKESLKIAKRMSFAYPYSFSIHRMTGKGAKRLGLEKYFTAKKGSVVNFVNLKTKELI